MKFNRIELNEILDKWNEFIIGVAPGLEDPKNFGRIQRELFNSVYDINPDQVRICEKL